MEIGSTSAQSQQTAGAASSATSQGGAAISSDFETFIKMLTVQMQNQDPLNPIESADFAVQLATFSSVEQQVLTNNLLTNLGQQIGALSVAQLSGWVGMNARAEMPVEFDGAPVTLTLRTDKLADKAQLVVLNSQGQEVQRLDTDTAGGEYVWTGVDDLGNPMPTGTYTMTVESYSQGNLMGTQPVEVHGRIVEARNDNGKPTLVMETGQQVSADQILGLRESN